MTQTQTQKKGGKVIVISDAQSTSLMAYAQVGADTDTFVTNILTWFKGGQGGSFVNIDEDDTFLPSAFKDTVERNGGSLDWVPSPPENLPDFLAKYNGVFLSRTQVDNNALIDYVNAGGCVYIAGGGSPGESSAWNTFLSQFDIALKDGTEPYIGLAELVPNDHPLMRGVSSLYFEQFSPIGLITPTDPGPQLSQTVGVSGTTPMIIVADASLKTQTGTDSVAETLASGQQDPYGLAVDATSIYWTNIDGGTVMKMGLDGSTPIPLASGQSGPQGLAVDATSVYWANNGDNTGMWRMGLDGGTPTQLTFGARALGITVDATSIYWSNIQDGTVMKADLGSGTPTNLTPGYANSLESHFIAVDATTVYWTDGTQTGLWKLESGRVSVIQVPIMSIDLWGIAVDETSIYWADNCNGGHVWKAGLDGSNATPIVYGLGGPGGMAVDATSVYWTSRTAGTVMKLKKGFILIGSGQQGPAHVAVDETGVYWTNTTDGTVMKLYLDDGMVVPIVREQAQPTGIVADATSIYWTNRGDGTVIKADRYGENCIQLASGQDQPGSIAVDATSVYWANGGGTVMKVGLNGGTPTPLASGQDQPNGIAVDATSVYWTNVDGGTVMKVGLDGGTPITLASGQKSPMWLAVDATSVYWTNQFSGGTVMKVGLDGGTPTPLASVSSRGAPFGITVDATGVYWTDIDGGMVLKLEK